MVSALMDEYKPQITLITQTSMHTAGLFFVVKTAESSFKPVQICEICGKIDYSRAISYNLLNHF